MKSIVDEFIEEEKETIRERIAEVIAGRSHGLEQLSFNRFDLILDFDNKSALVEDVLTPGSAGEQRLPLGEFLFRLNT